MAKSFQVELPKTRAGWAFTIVGTLFVTFVFWVFISPPGSSRARELAAIDGSDQVEAYDQALYRLSGYCTESGWEIQNQIKETHRRVTVAYNTDHTAFDVLQSVAKGSQAFQKPQSCMGLFAAFERTVKGD